jgi:hypothetical protein
MRVDDMASMYADMPYQRLRRDHVPWGLTSQGGDGNSRRRGCLLTSRGGAEDTHYRCGRLMSRGGAEGLRCCGCLLM